MPLVKVHTFTAKNFIDRNSIQIPKDQDMFMLGANFPDIRDVIGIKRDITHPVLQSISQLDRVNTPFMKGVYFHSFIDEIWYEYFKKAGYPDIPSEAELAIKMIAEKYTPNLPVPELTEESILEIQKSFNFSHEYITQWYRIVSISQRSNTNLETSLDMLKFFPRRNSSLVKEYYTKYDSNQRVKQTLTDFLKRASQLVSV